ncbi:hypothetical protein [Armatimonas rosea]|uniref:Uncharacterized protein n=1 Tax=Armatimonas rosea TaxID=685828 RepID=A0A7W9W894_ARMRO|nr:hypothetical protein [Armatimonas rosea]MBB6053284.1 hypothetical protein [Armatimonas rosea]
MAVKKYALYRRVARRGFGGPCEKKVIEVEEGTQPQGAIEVAPETELQDWAPVAEEGA